MAIFYKKRRTYKYFLVNSYCFPTHWRLTHAINNAFLQLDVDGTLHIAAKYAWDGASGPMPDLPSIMRASLVHDALYQLMREGHLDQSHRAAADEILFQLCRSDGMNILLAYWVYFCVRSFGERSAQSDLLELKPRV
jgi:hypothetical protein